MTVTFSWIWLNGMQSFLPGNGKIFPTIFRQFLAASLFGKRFLFRSYPVVRGMSHMANFYVFPRGLSKSYNFSQPLASLVNIVFRKRQRPNPMTSPIVGTILKLSSY